MSRNELTVRQKNQLMITPWQTCMSFLVLVPAFVLVSVVGDLAAAIWHQQWLVAAVCALFAYVAAQITLNNALAAPFMFFYLKQMSHNNYSRLNLWSTRAINLHHRLGLWKTAPYYTLKINRALCRIWLGRPGDGEIEMREVAQAISKHPSTAVNLSNNLAYAILKNNGPLEEAEESAKKCLSLLSKTSSNLNSAFCLFPLTNLGVIYFRQGKYEDAEAMLKQALGCTPPSPVTMSMFPVNFDFTRLNASLSLLEVLFKREKNEEAFDLLREVIRRIDSDPDLVSLECLDALSGVANDLMKQQRFKEAEFLLEHAYLLAGRNPDFPDAHTMLVSYIQLLESTDRASEIPDLKRWIRPIHLLTQVHTDDIS